MTQSILSPTKGLKSFVRSNSEFFTKKEKTWAIRLLKFSKSKHVDIVEYVSYLASLKLVAFKAEVRFVVKLVKEIGVNVNSFALRYMLSLESERADTTIFLPSDDRLLKTFDVLSFKAKVLLILLCSSGRRQIDLKRVKLSDVRFGESKIFFKVPKSKTSDLPLHFFVDLNEKDDFIDKVQFDVMEALKQILEEEGPNSFPFGSDSLFKEIAKAGGAGWRTHSLRARKCISLVCDAKVFIISVRIHAIY